MCHWARPAVTNAYRMACRARTAGPEIETETEAKIIHSSMHFRCSAPLTNLKRARTAEVSVFPPLIGEQCEHARGDKTVDDAAKILLNIENQWNEDRRAELVKRADANLRVAHEQI